jgi:hypothetical protein
MIPAGPHGGCRVGIEQHDIDGDAGIVMIASRSTFDCWQAMFVELLDQTKLRRASSASAIAT